MEYFLQRKYLSFVFTAVVVYVGSRSGVLSSVHAAPVPSAPSSDEYLSQPQRIYSAAPLPPRHGGARAKAHGHPAHLREAPCCLKFPTTQKKEVSYEDKTMIAPIFDTLLFRHSCPVGKSSANVCAAFAKLYTKPGTSVYAKSLRYQGGEGGSPSEFVSGAAPLFNEGGETSHAIFVDKHWLSHTHADVAIIENGSCFNIYPAVRPQDELSGKCHNPVLGHPDDFSDLFDYTIFTAGDVTVGAQPSPRAIPGEADQNKDAGPQAGPPQLPGPPLSKFYSPHSVVLGGNWKGTTSFVAASQSVTASGPFPGVGLLVGGNVDFAPSDVKSTIYVDHGVVALGGTDYGSRIMFPAERLALVKVGEVVGAISTLVCALSHTIQALPVSAVVTITKGNRIEITCELDARPCVAHLETSLFNSSRVVILIFSKDSQTVKINVMGGEVAVLQAATHVVVKPTASGSAPVHVVWNFVDTTTIVIEGTRGQSFPNSILAPRARQLTVARTIQGSVLLARHDSHFVSLVEAIPFRLAARVECPESEPQVTLCDCLCPDEKSVGGYVYA